MLKSIYYKEWLKIRWPSYIMGALSLLVLLNIFLRVNHDLKFMNANSYWAFVIERGFMFYASFMYVPLLIAVVISFAQFIPELNSSRLKLTLHLPVRPNEVLLQMVSFGGLILTVLYLGQILALVLITTIYFPREILRSEMVSILPWFIAGYAAYLAIAMIILERVWVRRILLILILAGFVNFLFYVHWYAIYSNSIFYFLLLAAFFCTSILISGYRFRKGVM